MTIYPPDKEHWSHPALVPKMIIGDRIPVYDVNKKPIIQLGSPEYFQLSEEERDEFFTDIRLATRLSITWLFAKTPFQPKVIVPSMLMYPSRVEPHFASTETTGVACLLCHGISEKGQWVTHGGERINDLVDEIEAAGLKIRGLMVCNPGSHALEGEKNSRIIYVTEGDSTCFLNQNNRGELICKILPDKGAKIVYPRRK